ncbi:MAG TPA: hypothetical protein VK151_01715 [Fluviicola sp.]|nr:hypothetical protein [Fluviicola sp.]
MKLTLTLLLSILLYSAKAQFSVSGGYIRRTEGRTLSLLSHFGTKPSLTDNLYNFIHLQTTYQANHLEAVGNVGFSLFNRSNYYCTEKYSWGGAWNGAHHLEKQYSSKINYSAMNLGLGLNWLFYKRKKTNKAFRTTTTIGFLLKAELLLNYKESDHLSTYYESKTTFVGPNTGTVVLENSSSDTTFQALIKTPSFLDFGVSLNQRFIFKSTYFLELKLNFSLTASQRFIPSHIKEWDDYYMTSNFPIDNHVFIPILETGIGLGYIFPVKKEKTP